MRADQLGRLTADLSEQGQRAAAGLIDRMLTTLIHGGRSPWGTCRQCDQDGCETYDHSCPVDVARLSMPADRDARNAQAGLQGAA